MPRAKLEKLGKRLAGSKAKLDERKRDYSRLLEECKYLDKQSDLLTKVDHTLQAISQKVLGGSITTVDKLVTSGLRVVFDDLNLEFKTVIERTRGRTGARLELYESGRTFPLTDSFGGGVLAVVGVLLRVAAILALDLKRVILLDETLAHLSEQYTENASKLMKKLSKDLHFTILLITHQSAFAQHADKHYQVMTRGGNSVFMEM